MKQNLHKSVDNSIDLALEGIRALKAALSENLKEPFAQAIETIRNTKGRVIVSGMGKSGHVAAKFAATLASTGTPAFYVHPAEASHGDLGMIRAHDTIIALSWSGETQELGSIINYAKRFSLPLIAITSNRNSTLGKHADVVLDLPDAREACPHGLAPTTSTTMQIVFSDTLAIALLESRGFTAADFKTYHPGGSLGANLSYVEDIMHIGDEMPLLSLEASVPEGLAVMTAKGFGCIGIVDPQGMLVGIFTDGDLRRHVNVKISNKRLKDIMIPDPKTVTPKTLVSEALKLISQGRISVLFIIDENKKPVGIVHTLDFLRIGVM